jgi:NTE family protein
MLWAMFNTAMVAHDAHYNEQPSVASRTIKIDNLGISPIAFDLSQAQKDALYASGRAGAQAFLDHWNFDAYIAQFRSGQQPQTKRQAALAQPSAIMPRSGG